MLLLEAGPDYGTFSHAAWPAPACLTRDTSRIPTAGTTLAWPTRHRRRPRRTTGREYWAGAPRITVAWRWQVTGAITMRGRSSGNDGWGWASVAPAFERARQALRVRQVPTEDASPYHSAFLDACTASGLPYVDNTDDPDGVVEVGYSPVNIRDGVRWNTALAYLDPVRGRGNLQIVGNVVVDRVELAGGRAVAVQVAGEDGITRIQAQRVVLCAGAYGSPAVLLRSGIGPPDELRALGITAGHPLPGVGKALQDHPSVGATFRASAELMDRLRRWDAERWLPDEQALAKTRSSQCREAFDLHVFTYAPRLADASGWNLQIWAACVEVRSTGSFSLTSTDPEVAPRIEHGFLTDPEGHDLAVLKDGLEIAREVAHRGAFGRELVLDDPDLEQVEPGGDLTQLIARRVGIYFHPACSCRMGPASDPLAVVDSSGGVHGLEGLSVCDASIFPRLMRANTNLPAAMLAEHLAPALAADRPVDQSKEPTP